MNWDQLTREVLDAASSAGVAVEREIIAAGPTWAPDCRMIVVHLSPVRVIDPSPRRARVPSLGMCAWVPQVDVITTFVDDCVPASEDGLTPPTAEEITAHATQYLADAEAIWDALSVFTETGIAGLDCENVRILESEHLGPLGRVVQTRIPLQVTLTGDIPPGS